MDHNPSLTQKVINYFNPPPELVPENGLKSLRFLRYDLVAGIVMTPIAYVFALSISRIAHMSAISGIESGILACLFLWLFANVFRKISPTFGRGSWLLIAGPAAALAPILADAVAGLGRGNEALGRVLVLPVIITAGIAMFLFAVLKLTRFTSMASKAVVKGSILAYIGFTICIKQIPTFFGVKFHESSMTGIIVEAFSFEHLHEINWIVFYVGLATMVVLGVHVLGQKLLKNTNSPLRHVFNFLPPPFTATLTALILGYTLTFDSSALIQLPNSLFSDGFDLGLNGLKLLWADPSLWPQFGLSSFKLSMVDTIEICGTVLALDSIDKYHRRSDMNNVLMAMAVTNIIGGFAGTQSNIPGGMKSTSNTKLEARTSNAAGFCGLFMFLTIVFSQSRSIVEHMPLVALGAIIAFVGWHLCEPKVWNQFRSKGKTLAQEFTKPGPFFVFVAGFFLSLYTGEILVGFFGAIFIEFFINYYHIYRTARLHAHNGVETSPMAVLRKIFRNPVVSSEMKDSTFYIELGGPVTTFNRRFVPECPVGANEVFVDADHHEVTYVDGTTEEFFSKTRKVCCGKGNFKLDGFVPVCPEGTPGSGMVRRVEQT